MRRWVFLVTFTAAVLCAAQDDLPAGKGKEQFQHICTSCHGTEQITGNRYTKRFWADLVDEMVSRGAEGSTDEIKQVVSYLSRNFGKQINVNTASAKEIEGDLSFTAEESLALVQYRTDHGKFKTFDDVAKVPGLRADMLDEQRKNMLF